MQSDKKIFDDMAKFASSAAGMASGLKQEIESGLRDRVNKLISDMDLVRRDDFDALKAVAVAAREAQEKLEDRLAELEARLAALEGLKKTGRQNKPATSKTSTSKTATTKASTKKPGGKAGAKAGA